MDLVVRSPMSVGLVHWARPAPSTTLVVKTTFDVLDDGEVVVSTRQLPLSVDEPGEGDELAAASDFAPRKARLDVLLLGHAHAAAPTREHRILVTFDGFRRELFAWSEKPRVRFPLVCSSLREGSGQGRATSAAPLAPSHPARRARASGRAIGPNGLAPGPLEASFDFGFFNAAPAEQQVGGISPQARLHLEGLFPGAPAYDVQLGGLRPFAATVRKDGVPEPVALLCDTVTVDADGRRISLVWRGALGPTTGLASTRLLLARADTPPSLGELLADGGTAEVVTEFPTVDLTAAAPGGAPAPPAPPRLAAPPAVPTFGRAPLAAPTFGARPAALPPPVRPPTATLSDDDEPATLPPPPFQTASAVTGAPKAPGTDDADPEGATLPPPPMAPPPTAPPAISSAGAGQTQPPPGFVGEVAPFPRFPRAPAIAPDVAAFVGGTSPPSAVSGDTTPPAPPVDLSPPPGLPPPPGAPAPAPLSIAATPSPLAVAPPPFIAGPPPFSAEPPPFIAEPPPFSGEPLPFIAAPPPSVAVPSPLVAAPPAVAAVPASVALMPSPPSAPLAGPAAAGSALAPYARVRVAIEAGRPRAAAAADLALSPSAWERMHRSTLRRVRLDPAFEREVAGALAEARRQYAQDAARGAVSAQQRTIGAKLPHSPT